MVNLQIASIYALLACHAAVIYLWISDWDVLMTPVGLVVWGGGVAVSLTILHFRPRIHPSLPPASFRFCVAADTLALS
ncbi:hypothetical protein D9547_03180 [Geobacillus stearothermophilus]|uniref:Uncharacterized protein n=1 Tax=Geobacillus stearothermophilus TaxID=1422 RepID=A0A3L7D611_GEOSE|nr:hypothetical protein D9545_08700 [Geobacillus stearothermophilus]RLQ10039.1 hypothetical protein D9549_03155 [Geobacillus stearothermophilus]RLQ11999.1 hypothetical protein D9547_03180 [Geobacillus stearothermophilus]RLQ13967.1 hypothetical protein D9548_08410 [Geobacillus stearothermophilus]